MRKPVAHPTARQSGTSAAPLRSPRAFSIERAEIDAASPYAWQEPETAALPDNSPKKTNWWLRIAVFAGGLLVSLGLGLAAERLITDLFARFDWLGWVGSGLVVIFVGAILGLLAREFFALRRLKNLEHLRHAARAIHAGGSRTDAVALVNELQVLYQPRPDLAHARLELDAELQDQFDGTQMVSSAERHLMAPLDARARALTAAAARRVALVTAVSPRALVDLLFVAYESLKLTRAIAQIYGSRPGLLSGWKLSGAVLGHLAVTGGVALGDSVVEQLLGQGMAARLSARLGEGLVNGLMTARVGIAAMQVTRPLPFHTLKQPKVMDYALELGKLTKTKPRSGPGANGV